MPEKTKYSDQKDKLFRELSKLSEAPSRTEKIHILIEETIRDAELRQRELKAITNGAKAVLSQKSFTEAARSIFDYCKELIGASSGYVALLNETGMENEVLFLEAGGLPCTVDPDLPMPIRGLRADAYHLNKAVYHNDFMNSEWLEFMPEGHVILHNVMFAPLVLEGKTVGIIGLANKHGDFDDNDAKMATSFGELAAIALQNSRHQDERLKAEKQRESVIKELKKALSEVKELSGLLPICSHCKKIRDDQGYWKRIERYIEDHSRATFSHGICRECADEYYPGMGLYDDE